MGVPLNTYAAQCQDNDDCSPGERCVGSLGVSDAVGEFIGGGNCVPISCECVIEIEGRVGCSVDQVTRFPIGQNFSINNVIEQINGCGTRKPILRTALRNQGYDLDDAQCFLPTESDCSLRTSGTEMGHDYRISCGVTQAAPNFAGSGQCTTSAGFGFGEVSDRVQQEGSLGSCFCNTSNASGVLVPYGSREACEVPEQRPHPDDPSVFLINCVWSETGDSTPLEPVLDVEGGSFFGDEIGSEAMADIQRTKSDLASLNKLGTRSIPTLIGRAMQVMLGIFGSITLIMVVYGGALMMLGGTGGDKFKKGTSIILWSSIAFVVLIASYGIVQFIFQIIG